MKKLRNPRLMWGCPPSEQQALKFLDGMKEHWPRVAPSEGDTVLLPFIVDAATNLPIRVTVVQTQLRQDAAGDLLVVVVARADHRH